MWLKRMGSVVIDADDRGVHNQDTDGGKTQEG